MCVFALASIQRFHAGPPLLYDEPKNPLPNHYYDGASCSRRICQADPSDKVTLAVGVGLSRSRMQIGQTARLAAVPRRPTSPAGRISYYATKGPPDKRRARKVLRQSRHSHRGPKKGRRMRLCVTNLLLLAIAGSLPAQTSAPARDSAQTGKPSVAEQQPLRPGDVVRLRIWREPDLSGDFQVNEAGVVVFPMLGPTSVTSLSSASLRDSLVRGYQVFLRNPSVQVVLLRRVNVFGAVRNPGLYPVDPTMALGDVLAAAGGATAQGVPDEVRLVRAGKVISGNLSRDTRLADLPLQSGDQVVVPERSWVSQNTALVAAGITGAVSVFIALLNRR